MSDSAAVKRFRVGCALSSSKVKSLLRPSLLDLARDRGIDLVLIDLSNPLSQQSPFDCILHKLYHQDWKQQLDHFSSTNPNVLIIDPTDAIHKLHDRVTMLQPVTQLKLIATTGHHLTCGVPKQQLLIDDDDYDSAAAAAVQELGFPMLAKPLVVDGSSKSHKMALVFGPEGLKKLEPPIVLQEFVNHGGVIFKVYVAGEHVRCVERRSLPDISETLGKSLSESSGGLLSFSQISNLAMGLGGGSSSGDAHAHAIEGVEMPAASFVGEVASGLRQRLGLNLFNFDMIRDARNENRCLVIDINYFPGYEKLPSYETILTDFLWDILHQKY